MTPPAIHFRAAVALAGRFPALAGVDLNVAYGDVAVFLGANGAGKTSLLRACAGLLPVTSGDAVILGCDVVADPLEIRRRVGLLGHAAHLYDELNPVENVRFVLRAARSDIARADPALQRLGIVGRLRKTQVGRLSAGQRRRVVIAGLLARSPELWLLDEPHAGLDASTRELLGVLIEEAASSGATVLLSSHEPELAVPLADRVITLAGGRVVGETTGGRKRVRSLTERSRADVA
ncbi:MAG: ABC transporter ATP-binding protein [Acidimicrobiales bacterium]